MNEQRHRKMKQIVFEFLTNKIKREKAVNELMEIGFTRLEAVFELNQWELK